MSWLDSARGRVAGGFVAGLLFGVGLAVSRMTDPNKVLNFLDLAGHWDPSLALVLGAAVTVTLVGFRLVLKRPAPLFDSRFFLPERKEIDRPLLAGALLFGIGWGLAGYCPGPALASLTTLRADALAFVAAMVAGALLFRLVSRRAATARQ